MFWCKKTFQESFPDDHCRIFATQQQLFEFLDDKKRKETEPSRWLPFSIEFPSEQDVVQCLSRRTSTSTRALFKKSSVVEQKNIPNRKRCSSQAIREDYCLLYGKTPLSTQSRMFLASTMDGIQSIIQTISPHQLHLYEIIRESTPCHLYFDVERSSDYVCRQEEIDLDSLSCADEASDDEVVVCSKEKNEILVATVQSNHLSRIYRAPVSEYEKLLRSASSIPMRLCPLTCTILPDGIYTEEVLLSELSTFIGKHYPFLQLENGHRKILSSIEYLAHMVFVMRSVPLNADDSKVQKFSQHYVINFHRHIFDSNASVGEFVKHFVEYLQVRSGESLNVHRALFYHGAPVDENLTTGPSETRSSLTLPFLPRRCIIDTAVYSRNRMMRTLGSCKLGKGSVLKLESVIQNGKPINFKNSSPFENFMSTLIVAHHWSAPLSTKERSILHIEGQTNLARGALLKFGRIKYTQYEASFGPPYHFSDATYANSLGSISQIEASYRGICGCECFVTSTRRLCERYVILSIGGTRFCQNVMREHKSNNVYLVMDLVKRIWVQKCFDPDCSQYRSQPKPF